MTQAEKFLAAVLTPTGAQALANEGGAGAWTARVALEWLETSSWHLQLDVLPGTDIPFRVERVGFPWSSTASWSGWVGDVAFAEASMDLVAALIGALLGDPPARVSTRVARAGARAVGAMVAPAAASPLSATPSIEPAMDNMAPAAAPPLSRKPEFPPVRVAAAAASGDCGTCGQPQLSGGQLVGCLCLSGLLGSSKVKRVPGGWEVRLGAGWGAAAAEALRAMGEE